MESNKYLQITKKFLNSENTDIIEAMNVKVVDST